MGMLRHIRYACEAALIYCFYYFFLLLGLDRASAAGGWIARRLGPLLPVSANARRNLRYAMPELQEDAIEPIVRGMWENLGRVAGELPHLRKLTGEDFKQHVTLRHEELLWRMRDEAGTGIVVSGHFGNWEITPKTGFEFGLPMTLIYRQANNPWAERLIQKSRGTIDDVLYPKGREGARAAIHALQHGSFVGMLVDQKMNDGIATTFFGRRAMTAPAAAELALRFRCPILAARVVRGSGPHFTVDFSALPTEGRTAAEITQQINDLFEQWIREHPEQWLWVHNRWPTSDVLAGVSGAKMH